MTHFVPHRTIIYWQPRKKNWKFPTNTQLYVRKLLNLGAADEIERERILKQILLRCGVGLEKARSVLRIQGPSVPWLHGFQLFGCMWKKEKTEAQPFSSTVVFMTLLCSSRHLPISVLSPIFLLHFSLLVLFLQLKLDFCLQASRFIITTIPDVVFWPGAKLLEGKQPFNGGNSDPKLTAANVHMPPTMATLRAFGQTLIEAAAFLSHPENSNLETCTSTLYDYSIHCAALEVKPGEFIPGTTSVTANAATNAASNATVNGTTHAAANHATSDITTSIATMAGTTATTSTAATTTATSTASTTASSTAATTAADPAKPLQREWNWRQIQLDPAFLEIPPGDRQLTGAVNASLPDDASDTNPRVPPQVWIADEVETDWQVFDDEDEDENPQSLQAIGKYPLPRWIALRTLQFVVELFLGQLAISACGRGREFLLYFPWAYPPDIRP